MQKKQIFHKGLYYNYFIEFDGEDVSRIELLFKDAVRLGEVYLGIIQYYDKRQRAYFVNLGKEEVYLKKPKKDLALKAGDNVIVEVTTERIKAKKATVSLAISNEDLILAKGIELNPAHYSRPQLLFSPYDLQSNDKDKTINYQEFKIKKFSNNLFYYCDLINELKRLLPAVVETKRGAIFRVEELETLTAIDVDAGSFKASGNFAYQLNTYVAPLIIAKLNQLAISGTVLIDFVNMNKLDSKNFLEKFKLFAPDFNCKGFTKTGLLELAISKRKRSLWQSVIERDGLNYNIKTEIRIDYQLDKMVYDYLTTGEKEHRLKVPFSYVASVKKLINDSNYFANYPDLEIGIYS